MKRNLVFGAALAACACFAFAAADAAETSGESSVSETRVTAFRAGEWDVSFAPAGQTLTLRHAASGTEVAGRFSFTGPDRATDAAAVPVRDWRVVSSRDGVPHRLAIVDPNNDAQGYVTFQPNGGRLSLLVYHRTALAYRGAFTFAGRITARPDAFAATTQPKDRKSTRLNSSH